MTEFTELHPENVPGRFFVDETCIICDLCFEVAPASFAPSNDGAQSIVYRQPVTKEEIADAEEAQESCPVEAIQQSQRNVSVQFGR